MATFADWVKDEIDKRGWQQSDLARRAGIKQGTLSRILGETRGAGPDVCNAIAEALGIDYVIVHRRAGLIPPGPDPESAPGFWEAWSVIKTLTPEQRERVIRYARFEREQGT
jgi:transcriptional regulator with XRE-family HTH domain